MKTLPAPGGKCDIEDYQPRLVRTRKMMAVVGLDDHQVAGLQIHRLAVDLVDSHSGKHQEHLEEIVGMADGNLTAAKVSDRHVGAVGSDVEVGEQQLLHQ